MEIYKYELKYYIYLIDKQIYNINNLIYRMIRLYVTKMEGIIHIQYYLHYLYNFLYIITIDYKY